MDSFKREERVLNKENEGEKLVEEKGRMGSV